MFGDSMTNPMRWELVELRTICSKITDGEHITPKRASQGVYLLSARNILNHRIDIADVDYIDESEYARISKRLVPKKGNILISCSGSVGRVAQIKDDTRYQMVRSVAILQLDKQVEPSFVEYCFTTNFIQMQILQSINQSSQANLFIRKIHNIRIPLPPIENQIHFTNFVRQTDKSKFVIESAIILVRQ